MSVNEMESKVKEFRELRRMAEELDAEIAAIQWSDRPPRRIFLRSATLHSAKFGALHVVDFLGVSRLHTS